MYISIYEQILLACGLHFEIVSLGIHWKCYRCSLMWSGALDGLVCSLVAPVQPR